MAGSNGSPDESPYKWKPNEKTAAQSEFLVLFEVNKEY
jgi:hypothetical protein